MARYHKVRIGTVWLTTDGTEGSFACKVLVIGLDSLQIAHIGSVVKAADNKPFLFSIESDGRGKDLEFQMSFSNKDVLDDIRTEMNALIAANQPIPVKITGGPFGNFDFNCLPLMPNAISFPGRFSNDHIPDVILRITILEPIEIEEEEE